MYYCIGFLLNAIRMERGLSVKALTKGICSDRTYLDIEKDLEMPDIRILRLLFERLGKSFNKLELIINENTYACELNQFEFNCAIGTLNLKKAGELLEQNGKRKADRNNVAEMFRFRNLANLKSVEGNCESSVNHIKNAIISTVPEWGKVPMYTLALSCTEIENILIYVFLNYKTRFSANPNDSERLSLWEESFRILDEIAEYMNHYKMDDECLSVIIPKLSYVRAVMQIDMGSTDNAVFESLNGLKMLRKHEILFMTHALLKIIVTYGKDYDFKENEDSYDDYCHYYETLNRIFQSFHEYSVDYYYDSLFMRCNKSLYHLDSEVIKGLRKQNRITQAGISENIYQNPESYSRAESGKTSMNTEYFRALLDRLKIHRDRFNLCLLCMNADSFDLFHETTVSALKGNSSEALELCGKLESILDMSLDYNRTALSMLKSYIEPGYEGFNKERAEALLEDTYPVLNNEVFRPPFNDEMQSISQIGICLFNENRKDEALRLYEKVLKSFAKSKVDHAFQYKTYGLLIGNYARLSLRDSDAVISFKNHLLCGTLSGLDADICVRGYSKLRAGEYRKKCKPELEDAYYLSKLTQHKQDIERLEVFLSQVFGSDSGA